ncbi:LptF/LptG family permease [Aliarcobacter trophiarum]|uniref:LptF/LptG family permease n=1 Tax=Aliarcobacter trophiarum TaxID=708186 RepID=UPI00100A4BF0|nr:LptF/LptG family permease [Aliarcobacter trophiarum]RXI28634.1 permease [Aliarcobacter trophiarum]
MRILTKYIIEKYLKNFIIILLSLEIFFVGIDFLQNFKSLPQSANLQLLYIFYNGFFTLTLTLPLSIVFAWITTLIILIKNNEYVAFYSLGAKKGDIFLPVLSLGLIFLFILIVLQMTPLAYSYEQKKKILENEYFSSTKSDIFLKYNDNFVYFQKLFPLEKKAENIHIFKIDGKDVIETIVAQKAYFQNNKWYVVDAKVTTKPKDIDMNSKLTIRYEKFLNTLDGFQPKILDNVYEARNESSLLDAINAMFLLEKQGVNTSKIRGNIYNQLFVPFFVIPILFLVFAYSSLNSRFFRLGTFVSFGIFGTLIIWGIFFFLYKITSSGVLNPELSLLLPIAIWFTLAFYIYKIKIKTI